METSGHMSYKEKFYYKKGKLLPHIYTVCLLVDKESDVALARGVAICSVFDQPDKKIARKKARDRAVKALGTKKNGDPINFDTRDGAFTYKDFKHSPQMEKELPEIIEEHEKLVSLALDHFSFLEDDFEWIIQYENFTRIMIPVSLPIAITAQDFSYKSEYNPVLSENEKFIVTKR